MAEDITSPKLEGKALELVQAVANELSESVKSVGFDGLVVDRSQFSATKSAVVECSMCDELTDDDLLMTLQTIYGVLLRIGAQLTAIPNESVFVLPNDRLLFYETENLLNDTLGRPQVIANPNTMRGRDEAQKK